MKPAYLALLRDSLLLSPRLLGATVRVLLGRMLANPASRLRRLISVESLGRELKLDPLLISSATVEGVHSGTATRSRLNIRYVDPLSAPGPTTLFIKSSPADFASALFGVLFDLGGNEVSFYRQIRADVPSRAPELHYCEGNSSDYVLLLEDLAEKSCSFRDLTSKCTLAEATSVVTTLAELHACFWQSERFDGDLDWVHRYETNREFRLARLLRELSLPITFKKFGPLFSKRVRRIVPDLMRHYDLLETQWAQEPRTLIHGDAHLGNIYFQAGDAGLLDWQVCQYGQGMRDVSYFLINSLDTEFRLTHQTALIEHYLAKLGERGAELGFEMAWRQYRLHSVYAWIAGVVTAPSKFQEESVVVSGLSRSCKAIVDLDAVELIRAL